MVGIENYQELANAIVLQAVKDWRGAVQSLKRHPDHYSPRKVKRECEEFFLSQRFVALTGVDGSAILAGLKKEAGDDE